MSYHQIARAFADSLFQRRHGFGLPGGVDVARTTAREPPEEHPWGEVNDLVPNRAASVEGDALEEIFVCPSAELRMIQEVGHIHLPGSPVVESQPQPVMRQGAYFFHGDVSALRCHEPKYSAFSRLKPCHLFEF